ncbi:unnamed protein product [Lathyrus oleraceus]
MQTGSLQYVNQTLRLHTTILNYHEASIGKLQNNRQHPTIKILFFQDQRKWKRKLVYREWQPKGYIHGHNKKHISQHGVHWHTGSSPSVIATNIDISLLSKVIHLQATRSSGIMIKHSSHTKQQVIILVSLHKSHRPFK